MQHTKLWRSAIRNEYDGLRGSNAQPSDSYFSDEENKEPPGEDPLTRDWNIALKYYPDLRELDVRLSKISWRLSNTYRAYILEAKAFAERVKLAHLMETDFLRAYFGSNPQILAFAREIVGLGNKAAARSLNEAVRVLGSTTDPQRVIGQIRNEFNIAVESGQIRGDGNPLNWKA
ncbi:MAG TPA: hypothetical protein PKD55_24485 [Bellilinea sp.]|nr:hypothetical protein [Bellilinea sp.]